MPNGKVLVAGESLGEYFGMPYAELYDPITDTWTMTSSMQQSRNFHATSLLPNGKVLVTGARDDVEGFASTELYNPIKGN